MLMASKKESLSVTHPELALQADGWNPNSLNSGSGNKPRSWICGQGHKWLARLPDRIKGNACPYCSGRLAIVGLNDLATLNPALAVEADGWDPTKVKIRSNRKVAWRCAIGHSYVASIDKRSMGSGCPVCDGKKVLPGFNDLATTNPDLAIEADGWDPTTVTQSSSKSIFQWQCASGHTWKTTPASRSNGRGCPVCANKKVLPGFNDLATTNPALAAEADGWDPTTVTQSAYQSENWQCPSGHHYSAAIYARNSGSGCPVCDGKKVLPGFNDLATTNPDLALEADGWDPTTVTQSSDKKMQWMCKTGHRYLSTLGNRTAGKGCPVCANKKVLPGFNDLATTNPALAAEADGWDPTTVTNGAKVVHRWKCKLGHQWKAAIYSRNSGVGCPVCANKKVLPGFNDLATTNPDLAREADGWDPTTVTQSSGRKRGWICNNGHRWSADPAHRTAGRGCPSCAKFGFDPNLNGFLYLIDNFDLHMLQIGITNYPDKRLDQHGRSGWEVIELRGPMEGHLAQQLETEILHAVERRGAVLGHKAQIEKFDGYSEAWTKDSLSVTSFKQLLDWVYEDDQSTFHLQK